MNRRRSSARVPPWRFEAPRAASIRHLALVERAQNYLAQNKTGMARKDLERILAEDSSYEGVREQLAELNA